MPMEGDFMGDGDMPQPPQDNNQVQPFSNFENKSQTNGGFLDQTPKIISQESFHTFSQVAAWYDTDL